MNQSDACIVRITDAKGNTLGTGFLIATDGRIATCTHVVEGVEPCVTFPGSEPRPAQVVATDPVHDVAILKLEGDLPPGAEPARMGHSAEGHYSNFRSRGYRPLGEMQGIPAEGRVLHAVSECPDAQYLPLILKSQDIRKGMSGAPVYIPDLDLVVGMITGYWDSLKAETGFRDAETGFAVPSEAIVALCPDIPIYEPSPKFRRPPFGIPFQAPAVPPYFVPRPEVSNSLKAQLVTDEATSPGALVVSAVHGLGGIGKTTLIAALAHDPVLQTRFPDGVLWVTLGQEPELLPRLHEWIQALGDHAFNPTTEDGASTHLRTLLHDKACLLMVDDAWQANHVRPFLLGGEHCRVLVTTRDATLARKVGARLYDLDVMTEGQALALFEARLGLLGSNRETARALADELCYLPLALELAAAQVEAGVSWDELLNTFCQELVDLEALELDEATYRNESLRLSFRLSLERLSTDDQDAFTWLGVLPEDTCLNPEMAATLWDQSVIDACKRLHRFRDKALLKPSSEELYTIHDLLQDEARLRLHEQITLPDAHISLLERYQVHVRDNLWHTLPDDGYIHEHLTWHMEQAGWEDGLHALLQEETPEGQNGWYTAREPSGQVAGYAADVARAWRFAEKRNAIGSQIRYSLITASLNSLAQTIPYKLLIALVKKGIWSQAQSLTCALQVPDAVERLQQLTGLIPHLHDPLQREAIKRALTLAQEMEYGDVRARALADLISYLPESQRTQAFQEALATAWAMPEDKHQGETLAQIALKALESSYPEEALAAARKVWRIHDKVWTLAELIPFLPISLREVALQEALLTARRISYDRGQVWALNMLIPFLPRPLREEVIQEALVAAREGYASMSEFAELAANLSEPLKGQILRDLLDSARANLEVYFQAKELAELATWLPDPLKSETLKEALASTTRIDEAERRANVLIELIPNLPEPLLSEALQQAMIAVRSIQYEYSREQALTELVPFLTGEFLRDALIEAKTFQDDFKRQHALAGIASYLPTELLKEMLDTARGVGDEDARITALTKSALCLPQSSNALQEVLLIARVITDPYARVQALGELADHLIEPVRSEVLEEALTEVQAVKDGFFRTGAMVKLVAHLPQPMLDDTLQEALAALWTIDNEPLRATALVDLASQMPEAFLGDALAVVQALESEAVRAKALVGLASHLSESLLENALSTALVLEDARCQVEALAGLIHYLPKATREKAIGEALTTAHAIEDKAARAEALAQLAPYLPADLLQEALDLIQAMWNMKSRADALVKLAPYIPVEQLPETLAIVRAIRDEDDQRGYVQRSVQEARARALTGLAPHLPADLVPEMLAVMWEIEWSSVRAEALVGLIPHLPAGLLLDVLTSGREIALSSARARVLNAIIPRLSESMKSELFQEVLAAAWETGQEHERAAILIKLASHAITSTSAADCSLWQGIMHALATCARERLLEGILVLHPAIVALGGTEAVAETFRAIQDVGRWWP